MRSYKKYDLAVIVCGDRKWEDFDLVYEKIKGLVVLEPGLIVVIEGEAAGADVLGRQAAEMLYLEILPFKANWDRFGKAAGPIRNQEMLECLMALNAKRKLVLAFHDHFADSKGTKDMFRRAENAKIPTVLITHQSKMSAPVP